MKETTAIATIQLTYIGQADPNEVVKIDVLKRFMEDYIKSHLSVLGADDITVSYQLFIGDKDL